MAFCKRFPRLTPLARLACLARSGTAWMFVCCVASVHAQASPDPDPRLALAQSSNCMSCHSVSKDFMGPSFKRVAAQYDNVPSAQEILARKIAEGGVGVWGIVPMPANTQVTPDQAHALAEWILTLR
jgi:cytochrome c